MAYSSKLQLFLTGSADNTIKFWFINFKKKPHALKTIHEMTWPIDLRIENFYKNFYLIISLNSDNFVYLTYIEALSDDIKLSNALEKLDLNETFEEIIDISLNFDYKTRLLYLFETTKSKSRNENSNYYYLNTNNYYGLEWIISINNEKLVVEKKYDFKRKFSFHVLNDKENINKSDLKVVSFGKRYLS